MEILHRALDPIGVAVVGAAVAEVVPRGPAHLEIEEAIECDLLIIMAVGVLPELARVAIVDLAEEDEVSGMLAHFFAKALAELAPELVVDMLYGVDAEAIDPDFLDVEGVDAHELIDEFIEVSAAALCPDIAEAEEIAVDLLAIGFAEALVIEPLTAVSFDFCEDAIEIDALAEDLLRLAGLGLIDVPLRNVSPFGGIVESFFLKRRDPFALFVDVLGAIAVLIVEEKGADVVTNDVLDDADPFFMSQLHEIAVVGQTTVAIIRVGLSTERDGGSEVGVDIEKILCPITVVARLAGVALIVGRFPDILHRRRDPDRGDAEVIEIATLQGELDPTEISPVVEVDIFLLWIVGRGVATFRQIVGGISVIEAIRHHKIDDFVLPGASLGDAHATD